ncbi:MAG TPA: ABC transporter substrate-binding protein [Rhodocyclaceae bacterium]|nr:ABC transporter substrate-binding protein [Rhodocyclaceae bacterium]HMV53336.1 ABC transporter substrate-binding protein [Rhodocyclaceae bacterium]HMZ83011.1 ABC transporter substrate-binding protein [Rhodocyclaceae bacterium]HNA03137.1 ABC transporter substrate-binding protein [Rhodocyclaceae bacterium]HNB78447.1 ABC transporter substrate-binding protein [Rhodocyclaceae bacterium]
MNALFSKCMAVLALAVIPAFAAADDSTPDALVKTVTNDVLQIVRTDKDIQSGSTKRAIELIEQKVLPHFNFMRMTQLAVGRDWCGATPDQQKALAAEFRTLLVRTYSNALTSYKDQSVDFKPLKMQSSDTDVLVRSEIKQPGGKPVQLDYNLARLEGAKPCASAGGAVPAANAAPVAGWKVYDVIVAGVSLVTNYREQFSQEVRAGGIDGLIKSLQKRNAELAAGKPAAK